MRSISQILEAASGLTKSWDGIAKIIVPIVGSAGSVPLLANRIFPGLNPKIIEDVFWSTMIVAFVVGTVIYIVSVPQPGRPRVRWPIVCCLVLCICCLIGLFVLIGAEVSELPFLASLLARILFVGFFIGLSGSIGWIAALLLNTADATA
jgi:peptidoglycan/LPS O-acetylase OafA/YrhL